ncbi:IS21 family transposase [Paenibacillus thermotolerans]|uniref:IS21 family transposase n=1 Tax=Paenibacillus thermotolerans TaxID=3027807 RepID=UPI00236766AF|nr:MULTISPECIES: IS21 family transposase [unclassified Paenibacillus]
MEIHQLKERGFKVSQIAKKLGISRTTVYEYLSKSPEEMAVWMAAAKERTKKCDPHRQLILSWLKEHPDLSSAQIHDWLKERNLLEVGESTVRDYVRLLREEHQIPKTLSVRSYEAIPDLPMGQQAQVDFGQTAQKTADGKEIKLYFISFVLSHSRYKYAEWLDRPFTTRDVIRTHENAFKAFEGIPHELVYDQDSLIVVSENGGDIILTAEFQTYRSERELNLHICRKADPESKGKIENVVGYIKKNFAKHRTFFNLDHWNEQCTAWLERTGNGKVHNTTKKRPIEVFTLEKQHLRPVTNQINIKNVDSSIPRTVRKDNTVLYSSNRYSVPLGTYGKHKEVYVSEAAGDRLIIKDKPDGEVLADHAIHHGKGKLIQATQHRRDRTKGIESYIATVAKQFDDVEAAFAFLEEIRKSYPRYIRDQLGILCKMLDSTDTITRNKALQECMKRRLFSAAEFNDVVEYLHRQRQLNNEHIAKPKTSMKPLNELNSSVIDTKPEIRSFDEYAAILRGEPA